MKTYSRTDPLRIRLKMPVLDNYMLCGKSLGKVPIWVWWSGVPIPLAMQCIYLELSTLNLYIEILITQQCTLRWWNMIWGLFVFYFYFILFLKQAIFNDGVRAVNHLNSLKWNSLKDLSKQNKKTVFIHRNVLENIRTCGSPQF